MKNMLILLITGLSLFCKAETREITIDLGDVQPEYAPVSITTKDELLLVFENVKEDYFIGNGILSVFAITKSSAAGEVLSDDLVVEQDISNATQKVNITTLLDGLSGEQYYNLYSLKEGRVDEKVSEFSVKITDEEADDPIGEGGGSKLSTEGLGVIGAALGYNFDGAASWQNLSPEVFGGWSYTLRPKDKGSWFEYDLDVGVTFFPSNGIVDSSNALSAIMLPGNFNFAANNFLSVNKGGFRFFMPLGLGFKAISGLKDSIGTLTQLHLKGGLGFAFKEYFSANAMLVWGTHDFIDVTKKNFNDAFNRTDPKEKTEVFYLTVSVQTKITVKDTDIGYLFAQWRGLINKHDFRGYEQFRLFSMGIRTNFDWKAGAKANSLKARSNRLKAKANGLNNGNVKSRDIKGFRMPLM